MLRLFLLMKWIHVVAVIAVVGLHGMYGVWIVRAYRQRSALPFTLRTIGALDTWVAMPGFAALLLSGYAMARIGGTSTRTPWLLVGIVFVVALILVHVLVYRPTLRAFTAQAERDTPDVAALEAAAKREREVGIVMVLVMLLIVLLMVFKPSGGQIP